MNADTLDPRMVEMVDRARTGDAEAFTGIYDHYLDQIFGYVFRRVGHRQIAEDLVGDVFLRAYRRLPSFEWQGVDLGAWLMTIARNRVNDHFKSARFRFERTSDDLGEGSTGSTVDDPERVTIARDLARALGRALEDLRDEHREVIELRFVHDMSVAETAAVMDRSVGAVKALQYRALRALAELVRDQPGLSAISTLNTTVLSALVRFCLGGW